MMQPSMRLNLNGQWEPVAPQPQAWPAAPPAEPQSPSSPSHPASPQSLQWQTAGAQGAVVSFVQGASGGLDVVVGNERQVVLALSIDRGAEAVQCALQGGRSSTLELPEGKERADWIAQALGMLATRVGVPWSVARVAQAPKPQTVSPDAELLDFLSQVGMQGYYAMLRPHTNGTDDLAAFTEAQLQGFGVSKVVHRRKLLARVAAMTPEWHEERRVRREKRSAPEEKPPAPAAPEPPAEPAECAPVKWKPDNATNVCEQCWKDFTLLRRRHHCRACGGIFCGSCSEKKMLVGDSTTPQRVCDECYHQRKQAKRRERTAFAADLAPAFADLEGRADARHGGEQKGTKWSVQKKYEAEILNILDSQGGEQVDNVDGVVGINRRDPRFMYTWPLMDPAAQAAA